MVVGLGGCAGLSDAPPIVGEPCVTADEADPLFSGFSLNEVNLETRGSCGERAVCLGYQFQGRASCPEGQADATSGACLTLAGDPVVVAVAPQLESRPAELAVVCSCRCDGPQPNVEYCECPSGMRCEQLVAPGAFRETEDLSGSYCVY